MAKRRVNKSEFVRGMGNMPAAEIVKKAKQRGFDLSIGYVYNIRGAANRRSQRTVRPGRVARPSAHDFRASVDRLASNLVEQILRAVREAELQDIVRV